MKCTATDTTTPIREILDFHSHILPAVDDGSPDARTSLAMLRLSAAQGVGVMAATPHFYPHRESPEEFLKRRDKAAERLRASLPEGETLPKILLGAEVRFFEGMSLSRELPLLALEGTKLLLLEMPFLPWTQSMAQEVQAIRGRTGLIPVLAHIDRYLLPGKAAPGPKGALPGDFVVQLNAEAFFERRAAKMALSLIREGRPVLLGSDCHNVNDRAPMLARAAEIIERKAGREQLDRIHSLGAGILEGGALTG